MLLAWPWVWNIKTTRKVHISVAGRTNVFTLNSENVLSERENVDEFGVPSIEQNIPKEETEVTLEMPHLYRKRKKKCFDMEAHLQRRIHRVRRELQILIHKVQLFCWIAHIQYINSVMNSVILMAQCLSLIPSHIATHQNI